MSNEATAYGWRDRQFLLWLIADYPDGDAASRARYATWVRDFRSALAGRGSGAFVSFMAADDPESVAACYPPATFARLSQLKHRWDPDNFFRHNHNISPADGS